ncbi:hypothetical protein GCM10018987_57870 [Streptomyces cremeus]
MTKRYDRTTVVDGLDLDIAHDEALTLALSPAVVLMDLRMPGSGVTATARITAGEPAGRVLNEATVKTHLLRVFGELEVDDRTAAVTAAGRGLLAPEE